MADVRATARRLPPGPTLAPAVRDPSWHVQSGRCAVGRQHLRVGTVYRWLTRAIAVARPPSHEARQHQEVSATDDYEERLRRDAESYAQAHAHATARLQHAHDTAAVRDGIAGITGRRADNLHAIFAIARFWYRYRQLQELEATGNRRPSAGNTPC